MVLRQILYDIDSRAVLQADSINDTGDVYVSIHTNTYMSACSCIYIYAHIYDLLFSRHWCESPNVFAMAKTLELPLLRNCILTLEKATRSPGQSTGWRNLDMEKRDFLWSLRPMG